MVVNKTGSRFLLWMWVIASVVAGTIEYLTSFNQLFWIPYLMAVTLLVLSIRRKDTLKKFTNGSRASLFVVLLIWILLGIVSSLTAGISVVDIAVALKSYYFMWGLSIGIVAFNWNGATIKKFWDYVIWVALLQWPMLFYQILVIAPRRSDFAAWDAIVGTFGGAPDGGGNSSAMAFVGCIAAVAVVLRYIVLKELKATETIVMFFLVISPVFVAEVKMAFVWIFVIILYLGYVFSKNNRAKSFFAMMIAIPFVGLLGVVYVSANYGDSAGGMDEFYEKQIKYSLDSDEFNSDRSRLGRVAAIYFWQLNNTDPSDLKYLIGYGLNASRTSSSVSQGYVAEKYPYKIDLSTLTRLLWDTGVFGALIFMIFLLMIFLECHKRIFWKNLDPKERYSSLLSALVTLLLICSYFYNRDSTDNASLQMMLAIALGSVFQFNPPPRSVPLVGYR